MKLCLGLLLFVLFVCLFVFGVSCWFGLPSACITLFVLFTGDLLAGYCCAFRCLLVAC